MTLTLSGQASHPVRLTSKIHLAVLNPENIATLGLASSTFARHYSQNLVWFLFLPLLRCFSSGGSPHIPIYSVYDLWFFIIGVPTFGYLRISAYLQLPEAFRSLSRPSSASDAKAFSICSSSLELPSVYPLNILGSRHLAWIAVFHTCSLKTFFTSSSGKIVLHFYPYGKTWFRLQISRICVRFILFFPFTFVCHVFHTNSSLELICLLLFGFQWTF